MARINHWCDDVEGRLRARSQLTLQAASRDHPPAQPLRRRWSNLVIATSAMALLTSLSTANAVPLLVLTLLIGTFVLTVRVLGAARR
jgi:hypothetical protein